MVAFVEDVAGGNVVVVEPAPDGLGHDQSVVGDDEIGLAGVADDMFDGAAGVMWARGMDALAAPVGDVGQQGVAKKFGEPAGEVAAKKVAVRGCHGPAGDEAERDGVALDVHGVFVIEQAEVVFAAFAKHNFDVGAEAGGFLLDLALQVAGEGGDPDRTLVLLGPEAGGGEVAERFARAGAGFREDDMGVAGGHARFEGGGSGGGEIGLGRALLGAIAK